MDPSDATNTLSLVKPTGETAPQGGVGRNVGEYGLYIHVPFCVHRCPYCAFYTLPMTGRLQERHPDLPQQFVEALEMELKALPEGFAPTSIFIGGGTPTELPMPAFGHLFKAIEKNVDRRRLREWTCEANPGTLDDERIETLKKMGVDRVSLGVQSFQDEWLHLLGRIHSAEEAQTALTKLRDHGMGNVNLDLMFGLPGSSLDDLKADVETAIRLEPEHISIYNLSYEAGTPFRKWLENGWLDPAEADLEEQQYHWLRRRLQQAGWGQYEISNFAQPGFRCGHNRLYWGDGAYHSLGPSAHGHWGGVRYARVANLQTYIDRLRRDESTIEEEETLESAHKARESLVMGLRRLDGVDLNAFYRATGFTVDELCGDTLDKLVQGGYLRRTRRRLRLSRQALFVSDAVFKELM